MLAVVVEEKRFRAAFAFVVARARADRIDVALVILGLRVYLWIAIDLTGRSLQNADL